MTDEILINAGIGETRTALVSDGQLKELYFERLGATGEGSVDPHHGLLGSIILGRVKRVMPGMQAAFVDIGQKKAGFLGVREAKSLASSAPLDDDTLPAIGECVREGEAVLVQVIKEPMAAKGARLSADITLPGRLLVSVPLRPGIALSRRIEEQTERERLADVVEQVIERQYSLSGNGSGTDQAGGYILRTVSLGASADEIEQDMAALAETWEHVLERKAQARAPQMLYQDLGPVCRALRDYVRPHTRRILVDDADAYGEAKVYCNRTMPEMSDRLELFNGPGALFDLYDIEGDIASLFETSVSLPSGGWIMLEGTEALTAVDVNSGSYTDGRGLEETSVETNCEAARVLARQLRLRGIGGLIVVDFIHMDEPANVERVLTELQDAFAADRFPVQMTGMSEFGLLELTRKRVRAPLVQALTEACDHCAGRARIKSIVTVAHEILRQVARVPVSERGGPVRILAAPEVIAWLAARDATFLSDLRRRLDVSLELVAEPGMERDRFDIRVGDVQVGR